MINSKQKNPGTERILPVLLSVAFLLAGVLPASAVPALMTDYGDQFAWRGAEINGMGGTGSALYRGGLSTIYNPAFLVDEESVRLDVGFSLDQEHEDPHLPGHLVPLEQDHLRKEYVRRGGQPRSGQGFRG